MTCVNDEDDGIVWTYEGNVEINAPCRSNAPDTLQAIPVGTKQCDIAAWLENATYNFNLQSISGPYACIDSSSGGVASTSIVVVLGTFR